MKVLHGVLGIIVVLTVTTGIAVSAAETPQPAAVSKGTGTMPVSEGPALTVTVPLFSPNAVTVPLAMVNDEPVTVGDVTAALGSAHEERDPTKPESGGKIDFHNILERLINVRLIVQEATRIGFDELDEFKSAVNDYSTNALADQLMREVTRDVKSDPSAVDKLYKEMTVEWKVKSLFFEKEKDAMDMAEAIKKGTSYDELAKKAIDEKKAKGLDESNFVRPKDLAPHIMEALSTMESGSVSPILKVQSGKTIGYTIMKLEEKRYPENPTLREQAEGTILAMSKSRAWEEYKVSLT